MAHTGIIIQARMSSSRLPGKAMKDLAGKPVLWHVVERCRRSKRADEVIVATSVEKSDDVIAAFCERHGYSYYRGSLDNVLERYFICARSHGLEHIVRVAGASPLIEPTIIDAVIEELRNNEYDALTYVSNVLVRVFPRGFEVEAFPFAALAQAYSHAQTDEEREHVTPYMRKHFLNIPYTVSDDMRGDFRLTIDEIADFELLEHIYSIFYSPGTIIDTKAILEYLKKNPHIASINRHVQQRQVSC